MANQPPSHAFLQVREVLPMHLDQQQHVNNVVYLQFLQDIASLHWQTVMGPEAGSYGNWVVRRHEIDYRHPAVLGDTLELFTCTGEAAGIYWDRHYLIRRQSDQRLIVSAKSIWVLLDGATGKPIRPLPEILALFAPAS